MKLFMYKLVKFFGKPIYKVLYRPTIIGVDNIPLTGGVILAGNHTNNLDAAMMIAAPNRIVYMLAKKELFESKIGKWFYTSMGCVRVDRNIHDEDAKNETIRLLNSGKAIGIFPEGTTNKTNDMLLPFKYGAVSFALRTGCPIVPFAITGKYTKFKKNIKIEFGKPIEIKEDLEIENNRLMEIVKNMIIKGETNEKENK